MLRSKSNDVRFGITESLVSTFIDTGVDLGTATSGLPLMSSIAWAMAVRYVLSSEVATSVILVISLKSAIVNSISIM